MQNHTFKTKMSVFVSTLALTTIAATGVSAVAPHTAHAAGETKSQIAQQLAPKKANYGYYVDSYQKNVKDNDKPGTNPGIDIFDNTFLQYWSPANGGKKLDPNILQQNLDKSIAITKKRNQDETVRSYLTDRRDLRYNLISGLGPYANAFIKNAAAQTDYNDYPSTPLPGNTPYSSMTWADENSKLGDLVKLVNLTENSDWSGTGTPKSYIQFTRPYRQSDQVSVNPALKNVMANAKANDFDFPSGHTTAAFETGETLAYALPQRFQQLITRSSEVGYDRVLAGRHSPLAVMGGRVIGTAITASVLNDKNNSDLLKQAASEAQSKLLAKSTDKTSKDDFSSYQKNRADYRYRLTYGFKATGDTNKPMVVPKGAEVLLKTRLPYLNDSQRREVLYTTGLPSGYPMTGDTEGWGRLDLFSAANGYGAFLGNTTINMDASKGGFNAKDTFMNNIYGKGSLTKDGSGSLTLAGKNSFSGGTTVKDGSLVITNNSGLGNGDVKLNDGTLKVDTSKAVVKGNFKQANKASLTLDANDSLTINDNAKLGGTLSINPTHLKAGHYLLKADHLTGKFAKVHFDGHKGWTIQYTKHGVKLATK
ncbi:phosphatase PAP2 family protein [Lentilactobacillus sp. Marseille-Q4993]|uniref:phosphatase PAP2 family protein n=1 Tax=Lentilactobacillus sp. Marseille-Q4993 TaxID=3039492 RepID=UPI0024BC7322|nr:phosphatase PAP2 family protein [Lentilactobacillus sp. Marseille-Q4993]